MDRPMTPVPIQPTRVLDGLMSSVALAIERVMKVRQGSERMVVARERSKRRDSGIFFSFVYIDYIVVFFFSFFWG